MSAVFNSPTSKTAQCLKFLLAHFDFNTCLASQSLFEHSSCQMAPHPPLFSQLNCLPIHEGCKTLGQSRVFHDFSTFSRIFDLLSADFLFLCAEAGSLTSKLLVAHTIHRWNILESECTSSCQLRICSGTGTSFRSGSLNFVLASRVDS